MRALPNEGLHYFVKTLSWVCALRKVKSNRAFCFQFFPVGIHRKENNAGLIYENRMPAAGLYCLSKLMKFALKFASVGAINLY